MTDPQTFKKGKQRDGSEGFIGQTVAHANSGQAEAIRALVTSAPLHQTSDGTDKHSTVCA